MSDLVLLGINAIFLVFAWRCVFKPAIRDFVRDKLFDARDSLREQFLKAHGLEHPAYQHLRALFNHHIRFIEEQSLVKMIHFRAAVAGDQSTSNYINRRIADINEACGQDTREIADRYRQVANRWTKFYLVHSSFCLSGLFYVTFSVAVLAALPTAIRHARSRNRHPVRRTYVNRVDQTFDDKVIEGYPGRLGGAAIA
jgi:hypothetical protein